LPGPVYSVLIYEKHDLGFTDSIELDAGFVWIVRDIDVFFPGTALGATASVVAAIEGATFYSVSNPTVDIRGEWHQWQGRQVLIPQTGLDTLAITGGSNVGPGVDVRISGYKLTP
jgi:hypothetical protein